MLTADFVSAGMSEAVYHPGAYHEVWNSLQVFLVFQVFLVYRHALMYSSLAEASALMPPNYSSSPEFLLHWLLL